MKLKIPAGYAGTILDGNGQPCNVNGDICDMPDDAFNLSIWQYGFEVAEDIKPKASKVSNAG